MKKLTIILMAGLALLLISCATAPEPEPQPQPQPEQPQPEKPQPAKPVEKAVPLPEKELAEAKALKARVDSNVLAELAPEEYRQAEQKLKDGEAAYGKDNAAAKAALDAAIKGYNGVLAKAFPLKVERFQKEADTVRGNADALKAAVAMKEAYAAAKAKYDQAVAARNGGNFEQAIALFTEAKTLFQDVYLKTKEKKELAEAALKSTQEGLKDAEQKAKTADQEILGGAQ